MSEKLEVKPIAISFKCTKDDILLYSWIADHSNMSGFVKDILRREMRKELNMNKRSEY